MASVPTVMTQASDKHSAQTQEKHFDVCFARGADVLAAYWGFLADGGLIINNTANLVGGERVSLRVQVTSSGTDVTFSGTVARLLPPDRAVVAFLPGQPHDLLLSAALAETENVPPRRQRRYRTQLPAKVAADRKSPPLRAQVVNVSSSGCCVRLPASHRGDFGVGAPVTVFAEGTRTEGHVVWSSVTERGVAFAASHRAPPFGLPGPRLPSK